MKTLRWLKWRLWDRISLATAVRFHIPLEVWERWQKKWLEAEPK